MLLIKNKLLLSILNHGEAEHYMSIARECGSCGGTVIPAKGTASNAILEMLGLGTKAKEMVLILSDDETSEKIVKRAANDSKIHGVSAVVGSSEGNGMEKLISIIVNKGYSDDIMNAARKAGASGGTITHARGTAPNGEEKHFMNITVVPEKEMILILSKSEECEAIVNAIANLECLKEPGVGIMYVQDVESFVNLGPDK